MRDNEKEDARKRGGGVGGWGADKRVGAHSRYQFFRCGKIGGGGRINDGGRSGGTLRYMYNICHGSWSAVSMKSRHTRVLAPSVE